MHLKEYLEKNGIMKSWFAKQLGISNSNFINALSGRHAIPVHYWNKIIELCRGEVTAEDLLKMEKEGYERRTRQKRKAVVSAPDEDHS